MRDVIKLILKWIAVVVFSAIVGVLLGLALLQIPKPPKTFEMNGASITLPGDFSAKRDNSITCEGAYFCNDVEILAARDTMAFSRSITLAEYAESVRERNGYDQVLQAENGMPYISFVKDNDGKPIQNFLVLLEGKDAFWMFQITMWQEDAEKLFPKIFQWMDTVTFE